MWIIVEFICPLIECKAIFIRDRLSLAIVIVESKALYCLNCITNTFRSEGKNKFAKVPDHKSFF